MSMEVCGVAIAVKTDKGKVHSGCFFFDNEESAFLKDEDENLDSFSGIGGSEELRDCICEAFRSSMEEEDPDDEEACTFPEQMEDIGQDPDGFSELMDKIAEIPFESVSTVLLIAEEAVDGDHIRHWQKFSLKQSKVSSGRETARYSAKTRQYEPALWDLMSAKLAGNK